MLWPFTSSTWCFLELIGTSEFKRPIYWCVWFHWNFPLYLDGLAYPTFQLTDILGYSSKLIWLTCICVWYSELLCFRLSFVVTLLANVWSPYACNRKGEDIYTICNVTSNMSFIDVYLWEPVCALISTVLSQMILGGRVYAVCCLKCLAFYFIYFHGSLGFLTK